MSGIAVLSGLCVLVVAVLVVIVARLHAQVRRLAAELADVAASDFDSGDGPIVRAQSPLRVKPATTDLTSGVDADRGVPVITALPEPDDHVDMSARRVASVTLARPLIKVAALSYGLRRALDDEIRFKIRYAMRLEFRRQRKMRRRRRAGRAPLMGWRS